MARWLKLLAVLAGMGLLGLLWQVWPPPKDAVDRVAADDLAAALAPADLPLSAAQTDVIFVIACTLRRDRMGLYGGEGTTPFVDALARAGGHFERHYAQAPWTRPSVGTLVTGRWPRPLHLDNPGKRGSLSLVLDARFVTMAETLQQAGYRTVGAVSNPNASSAFGFAQGFEVYDEPGGRYRRGAEIPSGEELIDRVIGELDATPADQRFFGALLFTTTHEPRPVVPRYRLRFWSLRPSLRSYDATLRQLDDQLAQLYVSAKQRRKNLLFVLAADHGEGLRQPAHHGRGHGNHLFASTLQVPLIVQHPALPAGRAIGGLSMNIDVLPTMLDLLGLQPLAPTDGRSEADAIRGLRDTAVHERVFSETYYMRSKKTAVIEADWHLVHDLKKQRTRLFAVSDAGATTDLSAEHPAEVTRLAAILGDWEGQMTALAAEGAAVEAAPNADTTEMLKQLGYVEGDDDE